MFRCGSCKQLSKAGEKPVRRIAETRVKVYPKREFAMHTGRGATSKWIPDPGGFGTEIVREEILHGRCAGIPEGTVL